MTRRTHIGITLGPASDSPEVLSQMMEQGIDFVRLNFSHGTYETHSRAMQLVREMARKLEKQVTILQDLQGPKIRLGKLPESGLVIRAGQEIVGNTALSEYGGTDIPVMFPGLEESLQVGERILIDDGLIECKITQIERSRITLQVVNGGILKSHKGMNFPDSTLVAIPALTDKDKADVRFGVGAGVDSIALSFVKRAEDISELKELVMKAQQELGRNTRIELIAKIERPEGVKNIEEILAVVDGIMVARGDLGVEMPEKELPITQKNLIAAAKAAGKSVMVATQLLYSMEHNVRPTRAEVNDIANAVIDGATSLLLTNETAVGEHPVEAVRVLNEVVLATENSKYDDKND